MESLKKTYFSKLAAKVPNLQKTFSSLRKSSPSTQPSSKSRKSKLGLPLCLFWLYVSSGLTSLILLSLSILDLGYLSFWIIPPLSLFTLVLHAAFPFLAHTVRAEGAPSYFSSLIVAVYILAFGWIVAFLGVLIATCMKEKWRWNLQVVQESGGLATRGTQIVQIMLSFLEIMLLTTFAVKAHFHMLENGEPEKWRSPKVEDQEDTVGAPTIVFDSSERKHCGDDMKQIDLTPTNK